MNGASVSVSCGSGPRALGKNYGSSLAVIDDSSHSTNEVSKSLRS